MNKIIQHNVKITPWPIDDHSVDCIVTSPPYWGLRDYGHSDQIGQEETPELFVRSMVDVFTEAWRVLKPTGTLWLNLGDSYYNYRPGSGDAFPKQTIANSNQDLPKECFQRKNKIDGLKEKDLVGIPWMVAFALRSAGWYLRQDIIWHKPNPMPESVTDRCTKSHEYIFLLSKSEKYYYDHEAIKQKLSDPNRTNWQSGSRSNGENKDRNDNDLSKRSKGVEYVDANKRSVWTVNTMPYSDAHFATFPERLIIDCIKAGCAEGGIVLDPFMGAGTTALVSRKLGRNYIGLELNPEYIKIANDRLIKQLGMFI